MSETLDDQELAFARRRKIPLSLARSMIRAAGLAALEGEEDPRNAYVRGMYFGIVAAIGVIEEDFQTAGTSRAWKMARECERPVETPAKPRARRAAKPIADVVELKPAARVAR